MCQHKFAPLFCLRRAFHFISPSATMSRLFPLLKPRSVAVVGASPKENTLGNNVVVNLQRFGYGGRILPVHPSAPEVAGLPAFASLAALPVVPDCAVLAISADKVLATLEEGAARGLKAAVLFASGFAELGTEGLALQRELQALCARTGIVVCGPNCLAQSTYTTESRCTVRACPRACAQAAWRWSRIQARPALRSRRWGASGWPT